MGIAQATFIMLAIVVAPLLGGLLFGIDRRLSARLQNRMGPPILQPFYDLLKLFGKRRMAANTFQMVSVSTFLAATVLSLVLLLMGQDLLVLLFVLALGTIMLVLGGFSVKSPYSQIGSQRELMQMLAYEPLLVLLVVGTYLKTGSFQASSVFRLSVPIIASLPLFVLTQAIVLAIKLHKSPFDISGSHHAHQELVRGIYTEFSGPQLAVIELAHWYELPLLLGFIGMLCYSSGMTWYLNAALGTIVALACYFGVIVLDNITARMTWRWMLRFSWTFGLGLAVANLAALYAVPWLSGLGAAR